MTFSKASPFNKPIEGSPGPGRYSPMHPTKKVKGGPFLQAGRGLEGSKRTKANRVDDKNNPLVETVGKKLEMLMKDKNVSGLSIAVIKDGKIQTVFKGIDRTEVNERSLFNANSNSKLVTSVLFARLAECGAINLDKNVNEYFRELGCEFRLKCSDELGGGECARF